MYFNTYMNALSCGVYNFIYVSVLSIGAMFPGIRQRMGKIANYTFIFNALCVENVFQRFFGPTRI